MQGSGSGAPRSLTYFDCLQLTLCLTLHVHAHFIAIDRSRGGGGDRPIAPSWIRHCSAAGQRRTQEAYGVLLSNGCIVVHN